MGMITTITAEEFVKWLKPGYMVNVKTQGLRSCSLPVENDEIRAMALLFPHYRLNVEVDPIGWLFIIHSIN